MTTKDPDATLDYGINWSAWLAGDVITSSSWSEPEGIEVDSNTHDDTTTTVWVSGGTLGKIYRLTNTIITAAGRKEDRTIKLVIKNR